MWFFLLWLGFAVWVFFDAKKRCMKNPALEAVGVLALGIIFLPIYFAKRNLYKGEVREGGMAWNAVKVFALYWTITMFVASLAGLGAASQTVVKQTSEAAQAGAAIGTMLGMGLMIGLWFAVLAGALVIGLFLKKSSMVENGPTGGLAEQENPPKKLGTALLVVWAVISSTAVLAVSGKDGGKEEKISGNTKISAGASEVSESLPPLEARFVEIVSAAQRESHAAGNDMQRGGIKAKRDRVLCEAITSAVTDWIGTIEEVTSNSDGKGVLEIAVAEGIKIKTWNNALSDIGNNTLIEPGSPVFEAASAMRKGQRVAFSGIFFRGSQGDCIQESSMSLRGKLEEPEFIFRFSRVSANIPTQQPQVTQQNAAQPAVAFHAAPVQRQEVAPTQSDSEQALAAPKGKERIVKENLIKAAKTAVAAYKEDGMLGLIAKTQECYSNNGNKFYCVYLDFASKHIDLIMVNEAARQGVSLPKTKFFDDELFWPRISTVFEGANMSREAGDAYLHSLIPAINKLVNEVISREG